MQSSEWDHTSTTASEMLLEAVANACVLINLPSDGCNEKGYSRDAIGFLQLVERCLWKQSAEWTIPFHIALLGAGLEGDTGVPAIVAEAMDGMLTMDREKIVPRLIDQIVKGLAGFDGLGLADAEPLPLHSWNSAFLLAKMSKIDGVTRTTPETIDLMSNSDLFSWLQSRS